MKKEMLINVLQPEECRIAILEDGVLEELYVERTSHESYIGNIYKGRIVNIEPAIQAAFVDFGVGRNGFLHVSDVEPSYFRKLGEADRESADRGGSRPVPLSLDDEAHDPASNGDPAAASRPAARGRRPAFRGPNRHKPPIQEIFKRGQDVLVQVIKEGMGTKGPTLSTYISIPGRYLVLMPGLNRVGVSRKIEDEDQRRKLREIMNELNPPKGLGFIIRTAGIDRKKTELSRDLAYLLRLWKVVLRRIHKSKAPAPIYQESDMITRTIRDIFTSEIDTILIDDPAKFELAQEFLKIVMPRYVSRLQLYEDRQPLFFTYNLEEEIAKIQRRHVPLPYGGSIVIDQTEALVAIDVNSGNFRADNDAEKTAYQINLTAAKEIARQLRLRDLGGVIVNDFIDMRDEKHRRDVEKALRDAVKRDRARTKILRMSALGMIEMTRQRIRPSLKRSVYEDCPNCGGGGVVKTVESMSIDVMRLLQLAAPRPDIARINIVVHGAVAAYLNNRKRREVVMLEEEGQMSVSIRGDEHAPAEHLVFECFDPQGSEVKFLAQEQYHRNLRMPPKKDMLNAVPARSGPAPFGPITIPEIRPVREANVLDEY